MEVLSVQDDHLLAAWNALNPDRAIAAGDKIVQVNGKTGEWRTLVPELNAESTLLTIVFRKQAAVVGADQIVVAPALAGAPPTRVASIAPAPAACSDPDSDPARAPDSDPAVEDNPYATNREPHHAAIAEADALAAYCCSSADAPTGAESSDVVVELDKTAAVEQNLQQRLRSSACMQRLHAAGGRSATWRPLAPNEALNQRLQKRPRHASSLQIQIQLQLYAQLQLQLQPQLQLQLRERASTVTALTRGHLAWSTTHCRAT